jgi:signal transduction histidine kinase
VKRLYHQFYLTIVVSLVLLVLAAGALLRFGPRVAPNDQAIEMASELIAAVLPAADAAQTEQARAIAQLSRRLGVDLGLYDTSGQLSASAGKPILGEGGPPPGSGWVRARGGAAWAFRLPDGRSLLARAPLRHRHPALGLIAFLGALALAVALGAYPVVRRMTRRLERLQAGVEDLGAGKLSARIPLEGKDEIARLTASFNRSAERIEQLVGSQKLLLANASHELRTPLTRLKLGLELMRREDGDDRRAQIDADIAELDQLIEEILLASRLDAGAETLTLESVDLLGLAAEEASHYDEVTVTGQPIVMQGDARLLRRMLRNLLDNAMRHGRPPIAVHVERDKDRAILQVVDHGDPIPVAERDAIFQPFNRSEFPSKAHGPALGGRHGSGLGLALVRAIARQHGGEAELAGGASKGNTFRAILPLKGSARVAATSRQDT